jgi:hypothetical protein
MSKHKHGWSRAIVEQNDARFAQAAQKALDHQEMKRLLSRLVDKFSDRRVKGVSDGTH